MSIEPVVYLVGFGPGDPDLMTIKAYKLLKSADIILYDDLINQDFLIKNKPSNCKITYVGKRKDKHSKKQSEINQLLYEATLKYNKVIRLKGGDPFIFGRGGEELLFLREKNIKVEIVPGITASLAAAANAQIPLTMRGTAKYLTFMAAHHIDIDCFNSSEKETLVLYMAATKLKELQNKLLHQNYPLDTPIALLQNVSYSNEKKCVCSLKDLDQIQMGSPVVIIIGNVVNQFNT